mmetsp:Transcript_16698/g.21665  ORF Transcript_16698/g.21665 Transcript_16698/m.21665 type:complete len:119 (+) Transcript_16698:988-1344(+)
MMMMMTLIVAISLLNLNSNNLPQKRENGVLKAEGAGLFLQEEGETPQVVDVVAESSISKEGVKEGVVGGSAHEGEVIEEVVTQEEGSHQGDVEASAPEEEEEEEVAEGMKAALFLSEI